MDHRFRSLPGANHRLAGLLVVVALVLSPVLAMAQSTPASSQAGVTVVASGLSSPRDIAWDESGQMYVAQAGTGDTATSVGAAAAVVRIDNGCPVAVASGLPSSMDPFRDVLGPAAVAFLDGTLYVLQSATGARQEMNPATPNGIYAVEADGSLRLVADLTTWITASVNEPTFVPGDANELGEPFRMLAADGGFWVLESNRGEVLWVTTAGEVTRIADLSAEHPVLTGFALAPDGGVYVGDLTPAPHADGTAKVFKVSRDGNVETVWSNLTTVVGVVLDEAGTLYALEMATDNDNDMRAGTGKLVRQTGAASAEDVITGLNYPIALRLGPDGAMYIAFPAYGNNPQAGAVLRFELGGSEPVAFDQSLVTANTCAAATPYVPVTPGPAGTPVAPPEHNQGDASPAAETTVVVDIKDFAFVPAELTIAVGTTVTWTNSDPVPHTATATDDPRTFDSGNLPPGASYSYTFTEPGTIRYVCIYHPNMVGTIVVE